MQKSIQETAKSIRLRQISPVELTQRCLDQIEKMNPVLNAFITVTEDAAFSEARVAEREIANGRWRGPLHGIPVAVKDLIDTAGVVTTGASELFKNRAPQNDAEVVRRLKRAGAILVGKQNLHEFAYGGSSMISYFGEVRNPWNPARIAGGSSGGSASAVASGMCFASIGTDTAGSVREPAALCGIVGLMPTYGKVSTEGVIPLSPALDHVGTLTLTVADAAILLAVIAGGGDDTTVPGEDEAWTKPFPRLKIGLPRKFFYEDLDAEVAAAVEEAISVLKQLGCSIQDFDLEVPTDRTLTTAEAYAVHAGNVASHPELYQPETIRRIRKGEGITPQEIESCRRELQQTRSAIGKIFERVDVLVTPTTPVPAPTVEDLRQNPDELRPREIVLLRNTRPANVWALPAISVPCGFTRNGLPIGLQIIGPSGNESRVLALANAYEQATNWHRRGPEFS